MKVLGKLLTWQVSYMIEYGSKYIIAVRILTVNTSYGIYGHIKLFIIPTDNRITTQLDYLTADVFELI